MLFRGIYPVSAFFQEASGSLSKVDHWLTLFRGKSPVSAFFREASGPLSKVDHWLANAPKQGTSPHPPHTKSTAPRQGVQCFCFICL